MHIPVIPIDDDDIADEDQAEFENQMHAAANRVREALDEECDIAEELAKLGHFGPSCLTLYGDHWRPEATQGLVTLGLLPPASPGEAAVGWERHRQ